MVQQSTLDQVFHALSDPTRRAIVSRLALGEASVSELASPFAMSLSAIVQHVRLLEECGLVHSKKVGRVRTVALDTEVFAQAERWFAEHRALWARRFDRLGSFLAEDDAETSPEKGKR